ncbi:MAG: hypothetical protein ACKVHU_03380 [Acidimicrobiales bacterium]|jgi:hypothetical protein
MWRSGAGGEGDGPDGSATTAVVGLEATPAGHGYWTRADVQDERDAVAANQVDGGPSQPVSVMTMGNPRLVTDSQSPQPIHKSLAKTTAVQDLAHEITTVADRNQTHHGRTHRRQRKWGRSGTNFSQRFDDNPDVSHQKPKSDDEVLELGNVARRLPSIVARRISP